MKLALLLLLITLPTVAAIGATTQPSEPSEPTMVNKPWTRWWWLGSAVDKENITRLLEQYHEAGIGGVEICPIYGAKGAEDRFIDFLSPQWMEMLAHTTSEAKRLGMGVDLTTGTGWPFGGPMVSDREASGKVVLKAYDLPGGKQFNEYIDGNPLALRAFGADGQHVDFSQTAGWVAPAGKWRVYTVSDVAPIQKVKRAAPGGAGNVLDPYSVGAMEKYLSAFDAAFKGFDAPMPRAAFHDSFEYYGATWTPNFLEEFQKRRGYDLRDQLPALNGEGDEDTIARVKHDYRETISDLHLAYIRRWTKWAHDHGSLSRNQAHGAPGNLIDIYAAADIPETESFGETDDRAMPMHKLATSAAHVTGRNLASSESFTWLGEHFSVPLSDVKPAADFLFLTGVNHILFHGTPYSPKDVAWPGWLFYAAVNFGPNGGLWHDLPAFNAYVTRVQSVLQSGKSDNDLLLYWPVHDIWQSNSGGGGNLLTQFTVHDQSRWLWKTPFYETATKLQERGYTYDAISDELLSKASASDGKIRTSDSGQSYRAIVVPPCKVMPVETLAKLSELSRAGAKVIVLNAVPSDVPGLSNIENRQAALKKIRTDGFLIGSDLEDRLTAAGVAREAMVDLGLRFVRRTGGEGLDGGNNYFIVNRSEKGVDGWVLLAALGKSMAVIRDPAGLRPPDMAATREGKVYLQLQPGESCIVTMGGAWGGKRWEYLQSASEAEALAGTWQVHFLEGGPALPKDFSSDKLASWTMQDDPEAKRFAGTARYTLEFDRPSREAADWQLDLGHVCESARVTLNGHAIGTLFSKPFNCNVGALLQSGRNTLQIDVTNVAANRIADLDRRGVPWKAFHEINFVNKSYKPFDASHWPERDSGLLGPVTLTPLKAVDPNSVK